MFGRRCLRITLALLPLLTIAWIYISADSGLPGGSSMNKSGPGGQAPSAPPTPPPPPPPAKPHPLPPKPLLPPMQKPFGMPGVIGLEGDKWVGTDYLGYLADHIGIDVEILKSDTVHLDINPAVLQEIAAAAFTKKNIVPNAQVVEGPPLPFLHILLVVYPVDKDRFALFGNSRLFEQIQVIRKDFIPAGYWQGITWENQDVTLASGQELDAKAKAMVDKLATSFASRYRQYNILKGSMPPAGTPSMR